MSDHSEKVEADVQRVSKLLRGLAERCYAQAEEDDQPNFRFDSFGIVAIVTWENEDGDGFEDTAGVFESKRHHVQTGMLVDMLAGRMQARKSSDD